MKKRILISYELAKAAGKDAANRQMKANGRKKWSKGDYAIACQTFNRLRPHSRA